MAEDNRIDALEGELGKLKESFAILDKANAVISVTLKHEVELHENLLSAIKELSSTMSSLQLTMKEMQSEIKTTAEKTSALERTLVTVKSNSTEIDGIRTKIDSIETSQKESNKRAFDKIDALAKDIKEIQDGMEINIVKILSSGVSYFLAGAIGLAIGYAAQLFMNK